MLQDPGLYFWSQCFSSQSFHSALETRAVISLGLEPGLCLSLGREEPSRNSADPEGGLDLFILNKFSDNSDAQPGVGATVDLHRHLSHIWGRDSGGSLPHVSFSRKFRNLTWGQGSQLEKDRSMLLMYPACKTLPLRLHDTPVLPELVCFIISHCAVSLPSAGQKFFCAS